MTQRIGGLRDRYRVLFRTEAVSEMRTPMSATSQPVPDKEALVELDRCATELENLQRSYRSGLPVPSGTFIAKQS